MNVTCGQCVCPITTIETVSPTDLCQPINATYGVCHMSGSFPSWSGAFLSGMVMMLFILIMVFLIYNLFVGGYSKEKK